MKKTSEALEDKKGFVVCKLIFQLYCISVFYSKGYNNNQIFKCDKGKEP